MKSKFKKVISTCLAAVMLLSTAVIAPITVSAAQTQAVSTGETSGDFEYYDYGDGTAEITDYTGSATELTIPSELDGKTVISIDYCAFEDCTSLKSITIPNSVISIGYYAFYGCTSLKSITIPNSVISIGGEAFYGCTSLANIHVDSKNECYTEIDGVLFDKEVKTLVCCPAGKNSSSYSIPDSVTSIGDYAFEDCTSLASITIPNSVTEIGGSAFYDCTSLTSITIPNSVTSIGYGAFEDCTSLASITIPDSVTEIGTGAFSDTAWYDNQPDGVVYAGKVLYTYKGEMPENTTITVKDGTKSISDSAFSYCTSLASITIPDSVTSIGDEAFYDCTSLTNIYVDSKNESYTEIDGVLFDKEVKTLVCYPAGKKSSSYSIPDSVTSIGDEAFSDCTSLESVTIPDSVTSIGNGAFEDCTSLESVTIPDSVTEIGGFAFYGCISLTSITIPDSVTEIGYRAFFGCTSLTSITIPASVEYIDDNAFGYYYDVENNEVKIDGFTITGYLGSVAETYANDNGFEFISLGDLPVEFCLEYELTDNGEIEITCYTGSATEFTIPSELDGKKVTSIGDCAFEDCTSLASITIPNSVTSIGEYAFNCCTSLTSIKIPDSVTSIGEFAFNTCTSLASITIPDSVTEIGYGAFSGCSSLTSITIPDSVTEIGYVAFYGCTSLTSITIPDSVTEIGYGAFYGCTSLANIYVDSKNESYTEIDGVLFDKEVKTLVCCPAGKKSSSYSIPNSVTSIGIGAFRGCASLESVTIPDSVTEIGDEAFFGCTSLASITIPNSVTSIGNYVFFGCTSLTSITIPASVKYIGDRAFGYYYDDEYNEVKIDGFTITGYLGSAAETYANDNGFEFISLGEAPTTEPTEPATVITDKDTNVSVEGDIPEGIELNVESAEAVVENAVAAYNITLEKDGKAVQPDGKVTVKLPVPDGVDGSQCKVYYIDGDSKTDMNAVFVDGYLVFETDHFSVYAVVKTEKTSVLLGDVNADGKVNIKDATTIQKSAASLITLTEKQKKAADVNGDGKVNVNDVTAIQKYVAGIDTGFDIGK